MIYGGYRRMRTLRGLRRRLRGLHDGAHGVRLAGVADRPLRRGADRGAAGKATDAAGGAVARAQPGRPRRRPRWAAVGPTAGLSAGDAAELRQAPAPGAR